MSHTPSVASVIDELIDGKREPLSDGHRLAKQLAMLKEQSDFALALFLFVTSILVTSLRGTIVDQEARDANRLQRKLEKAAADALKTTGTLPKVDLDVFFVKDRHKDDEDKYQAACCEIAMALHKYGAVLVKDSRVDSQHNESFQDMMEAYFAQSDGVDDARPQHAYQVGVTPSRTEQARSNVEVKKRLTGDDEPKTKRIPDMDIKWRFFWRIGPPPPTTNFPRLNMDPVVPRNMPMWAETMDRWGELMMGAVTVVSEMVAVGLKLPPDAFTRLMAFGPHLLAPTGSDLANCSEGQVLAGFHTDLNFLTVHGKSRYPGLYIWSTDGHKLEVRVPEGYLLVQAGLQIEHLTAGYIKAGFHEVVVTGAAMALLSERQASGKSPWRISSTCFGHIQSDQLLQPLGMFASPQGMKSYPPILAGNQVQSELRAIALDRS